MKIPRIPLLLTITLLFGLFLTACTGPIPVNAWPGLAAGENVVYLAYQNGVFAVNASSGVMNWRFPGEADNSKSFYATPAVSDQQIVAGSYANSLFGIDPSTGGQKWAFTIETGYHFVGGPLVVNDVILAPASDYHLYAVDLNGQSLWKFKTSNVLWAQPSSNGELVFLPAMDHNLYALRLSDGSEVWRADLGSAMVNGGLLVDDVLYVDTMAGVVYAINTQDGSIIWQHNVGEKIWAAPVLHEENLYFGTSQGNIYALSTDPATDSAARVLWKVEAGDPVIGAGAVTSNGLVFVTENGNVQALGFGGEKLWSQKVNGKLYTTPVVAGDTVVVAVTGGDSLLTAYTVDGGQKWLFTVPK